MTPAAYNAFCGALPAARRVVQWGDAEVWKVGEKVFAIGRVQESGDMAVSFKCSPMAFAILKEQPGLRPAPYLASRGMMWVQWLSPESMPDDVLQDYLRESHRLWLRGSHAGCAASWGSAKHVPARCPRSRVMRD